MNEAKLKKEIAKLKETLTTISEIVGHPPNEDSVETEICTCIAVIEGEISIMEDMVS